MKFKITLKKSNDFADWNNFLNSAMKLLRTRYELTDEPDLCDCTLKEYFYNISEYQNDGSKRLRDFTIFLTGSDWRSNVEKIGNLTLVGDQYDKNSDDFCPECGSPDYSYYGDGVMYCSKCDTQTYIKDDYQQDDFDLFESLNTIFKP